jgi:DNA-binding beta-propeller fold protein YncE
MKKCMIRFITVALRYAVNNKRISTLFGYAVLFACLHVTLCAQLAYVSNVGSGISGYTVDPGTGALIPVAGSPFTDQPNGQPNSVTAAPNGKFLYVPNAATNNISAFRIDSATGAPQTIPGSPFPAGGLPVFLAVDPDSRFAYATNTVSGDISAYRIASGTPTVPPGTLTPIQAYSFGLTAFPQGIAIAFGGKFCYVALSYNGQTRGAIQAFAINRSTGSLTALGPPAAAGAFTYAIAIDPTGRFLYATNIGGGLSGYSIEPSGRLEPLRGSPFPTGQYPARLVIHDKFIYVPNLADDTVSVFAMDVATGELTPAPGSPFAVGPVPMSVAIAPSGDFAYVALRVSTTMSVPGSVAEFLIQPGTGALTPVGSSVATGVYPTQIVLVPISARSPTDMQ